jgi:hypothetical protein
LSGCLYSKLITFLLFVRSELTFPADLLKICHVCNWKYKIKNKLVNGICYVLKILSFFTSWVWNDIKRNTWLNLANILRVLVRKTEATATQFLMATLAYHSTCYLFWLGVREENTDCECSQSNWNQCIEMNLFNNTVRCVMWISDVRKKNGVKKAKESK